MTIKDKTLVLLGCGHLGSAMVRGLLAEGRAPDKIIATRRNLDRLQPLAEQGVQVTADNLAAVQQADLVVLAARPSQLGELLDEVAATINQRQCPVVSVVAGLTLESLHQRIQVPLIRSMPNVASELGLGVTIVQLSDANTELEQIADSLFGSMGLIVKAKDAAAVDSFTAVSGCGPAYFFYFVKLLCDYGISRGLDGAQVQQAAFHTIKGAAALLESKGMSPEELINSVAVPGEPTATRRGLDYMENQGLAEIFKQGCAQSTERAIEMGQEVARDLNKA